MAAGAKNPDPPADPKKYAPCGRPQTKAIFADFDSDKNGTDLVIAEGDENVKKKVFDGKLELVCAERSSLSEANDTRSIYNDILYCHAISLVKDAEHLQKTVEEHIKLGGEVTVNFAKVVDNLKATKAKLTAAKNLVPVVETEVKKHCNTEKRRSLGDVAKEEDVKHLYELASNTEEAADQAIETSVIVSGILAFTNVGSLKSHMEGLKTKADKLKEDAEANLKTTDEALKTTQKGLAEALAQLSEAEASWRRAHAVSEGIQEALAGVDKRGVPKNALKTITEKVKPTLDTLKPGSSVAVPKNSN